MTRDFFMDGFDENGFTYSTEYRARVLSKAKKPFEASLLWLVEVCALDHADVGDIMKLIVYRNNIAHQLGALLTGFEVQFDETAVERVPKYQRKVGNFWGIAAVDTDPDIDHSQVDRDGIIAGTTALLDYIHAVSEDIGRQQDSEQQDSKI